MISFIKKTKLLITLCYTSCTRENLDEEIEISSIQTDTDLKPEENINFDSYRYNYHNEFYSLSEINVSFPLLLKKAFVIFDNEKDALIHDGSISKAAGCKDDANNDTWGFKVRKTKQNVKSTMQNNASYIT